MEVAGHYATSPTWPQTWVSWWTADLPAATIIPLKIRPSNFENKQLFQWDLSNISPIIRLQN